jgi:hypothetical protein
MSRIYYYKLTADNGGAPCIDGNWLSLAICKPRIRSTAEKGSLVFGFAANSLHTDNRLIYIACVTEEKLREGAYYKNKNMQHGKTASMSGGTGFISGSPARCIMVPTM